MVGIVSELTHTHLQDDVVASQLSPAALEQRLRHRVLIANLWVIAATISCTMVLTIPLAEQPFVLMTGFVPYIGTNLVALALAYRGMPRQGLLLYTGQVFVTNAFSMVLINDLPTNMVLAMVNFLFLYAITLGRRSVLWLTFTMVVVLISSDILGDMCAPWFASLGLNIDTRIDQWTRTISLVTTTISTCFLLVTTLTLQERIRATVVSAHKKLKSAQDSLEQRHAHAQLLGELGAAAAMAGSLDALNEATEKALQHGLSHASPSFLDERPETPPHVRFGVGRTTRWLHVQHPLKADEQQFVQTIADLYEGARARMAADTRLRSSERLEGVGRLAAAVAHDFNNLLVPISAVMDLMANAAQVPQSVEQGLGPAQDAVHQAAALVDKLLSHTRSRIVQPYRVDLCALIQRNESLLRTFLPLEITIQFTLPEPSALVMGSTIDLEQVLLNLVLNARDAIGSQGRIDVTLHTSEDTVELLVEDNGPGIPKDRREWVLEPFNTTRMEGSGLGLATVARIVQEGNGQLTVGDSPLGGAAMRISFPRAAAVQQVTDVHDTPQSPSKDVFNVLLVEDEYSVRDALENLLLALGHQCDVVVNGQEALNVLIDNPHYDLVLTDYQMPVMNGEELLIQLRKQGDQRPVVFLSGYGSSLVFSSDLRPSRVLSKPVMMETLQHTLREAMQEHPSALSAVV